MVSILFMKTTQNDWPRRAQEMLDGSGGLSDLPRRLSVTLYSCLEVEQAAILALEKQYLAQWTEEYKFVCILEKLFMNGKASLNPLSLNSATSTFDL